MNANVNSTSAPRGVEINVLFLLETILKRWWLLLTAAVVVGLAAFGISALTTDYTYSTDLSFTAYSKEAENVITSSDINSSILMTNTFKYVISGRTMCERIAENCSFETTADKISKCLNIQTETDTNIIKVTVTTDSAEKTYEIAVRITEHYSDVVELAYPNAKMQLYEEPFYPEKPNVRTATTRMAIIGAIIGFAVALTAIIVVNALRDTVQSEDDIQTKLSSNLIGTVNSIHKKKEDKQKSLLITDHNLGFSFIEAYKGIRTKVESFCMRKDYKVIMVTSANENEGKTTFAVNLALSLAQKGKSVLLLDADMRKPAVHRSLNLNISSDEDLAAVISGKTELGKAIKFVEKYKIFLLATASANDEPTEMLSSQQMNKLIKAVKEEFDFVIIDTAPAAVVTDANIISNFADAAILVVRDNFAACSRIRSVIDDLEANNAELIGCVYNNVTSGGVRGAYGKYRYGYGGYGRRYGYGRGYGYGRSYGYGAAPSSGGDYPIDNE